MKSLIFQFLCIKTPDSDLYCFGKDYQINPLVPPKDLAKSLQNSTHLNKFIKAMG